MVQSSPVCFFRSRRYLSSRAVVGSETARFRACWGWLGCIGSERGDPLAVDVVVGDETAVGDAGGSSGFRLWNEGLWIELGRAGWCREAPGPSFGVLGRVSSFRRVNDVFMRTRPFVVP